MAKKRGYCNNVDGECSLAEEKTIQEADKTNFVCSECGRPLVEVSGTNDDNPFTWKKVAVAAAGLAVLGGGGYGVSTLFGGDAQEPTDSLLVDTVKADTMKVDTMKHEPVKEEPVKEEPVKEVPVEQPSTPQSTPKPKQVQNGYGTLRLSYGTYTGDIKDGKPHGHGKIVYSTTRKLVPSKEETASAGDWFEGEFRNGNISGPGTVSIDGNVTVFKP